jgi:hypothetical protein
MQKADWFWTIGLIVFFSASMIALSSTVQWLASTLLFSPSNFFHRVWTPWHYSHGIYRDSFKGSLVDYY